MGEVWRAKHLALNSHVAIKFLHGASAHNESARRRFTTEAQVTAQLKTRHAVQVFDFGVTEDGHPFLVMELLEGETLGHRLERFGRLGIVETVRILGQSARALSRAHTLGIVHRDFKPDNIVLTVDDDGSDYVKVLDFGLAKLVGILDTDGEAEDAPAEEPGPISAFTKTGAVLGTPYYMAPEQVRNASDVDLRADIWAFGVVAFECLTGIPPFTGASLVELFDRVQRSAHPRADELEPSLPKGFNDWFDRACAPDPGARFAVANAAFQNLIEALECGKVDLNPSASLRRSIPPADRSRPVVVVESGDDGARPDARTLDAASKRIQPRSRTDSDESAQFRKLTLSAAAKPSLRISDATMSHSIAQEPAPEVVAASHAPTLLDEPQSNRVRRRGVSPLAVAAVVVVGAGALIGAVHMAGSGEPRARIEKPGGDSASLEAVGAPAVSTQAPSLPLGTQNNAASPDAATLAAAEKPAPLAGPAPRSPEPRPSKSKARPPSTIAAAATPATPGSAAPAPPTPPAPKASVPDPASYR
jgi:serine/threonine-protein kinase